jgi:hypothetical protein
MSDGYVYRMRYNKFETDGDTTRLIDYRVYEYYDTDLDTMRATARELNADSNVRVTLDRRWIVRQPKWEKINL